MATDVRANRKSVPIRPFPLRENPPSVADDSAPDKTAAAEQPEPSTPAATRGSAVLDRFSDSLNLSRESLNLSRKTLNLSRDSVNLSRKLLNLSIDSLNLSIDSLNLSTNSKHLSTKTNNLSARKKHLSTKMKNPSPAALNPSGQPRSPPADPLAFVPARLSRCGGAMDSSRCSQGGCGGLVNGYSDRPNQTRQPRLRAAHAFPERAKPLSSGSC